MANSGDDRTAPASSAPPPRHDFFIALESVRGLAAFAVLAFHSAALLAASDKAALHKTVWQLRSFDECLRRLASVIFNGHAAVTLFFVLSGFVLALSLRRDERAGARQTAAFVGRRIFRIYPALAINVVITAAVVTWLAMTFPTVGFFTPTMRQITDNLLLFDFEVNGASWTLLIEMLAIPLLLLGHRVVRHRGNAALLALMAATVIILFMPGQVRRALPGEDKLLVMIRLFIVDCQFMFLLGMVVAELPAIERICAATRNAKAWIVAAIIGVLMARFMFGSSSRWTLLLEAGGGAVVIAVLAYGPRTSVHELLERRPLRFLGRISYSFYLYHATALLLVMPLCALLMTAEGTANHPFVASFLVAVATTIVTIPLAMASYRYIERPMVRLGRKL